jgi:3-hydroxyacyl-CoA dehydrogenase
MHHPNSEEIQRMTENTAAAGEVNWYAEDDVAVVTIANPPVNGLSDVVRKGLVAVLAEIANHSQLVGIVLVGEGRGFSGGADIRQFNTPAATADPILREVIARLARAHVPVVATIHGFCLGGGLELALGAHYRIARPEAKLGLTETSLGLLPGGGGTQRLPRLIGTGPALKMIVDAATISGIDAEANGLVDGVFTGDPATAGIEFIRARAASAETHPNLDDVEHAAPGDVDFASAREKAGQSRRNPTARSAAVDAVENATKLSIEEGLDAERALFLELVEGTESKALRHLFFAERAAKRIDGLPTDSPTRVLETAAVIGSGTMGTGIAMALADHGLPVTVVDTTDEALGRARERIAETYAAAVKKGRTSSSEADERRARITLTTDQSDVAESDIVIEAVFEDLEVKRGVFADLDRTVRQGAILASNTSRLDLNRIAEVTSRPADVIGLHFFSPANIMKLLEVVQGDETADDVLATAMKLAGDIGKQPVLSQVGEGFIGNRMLSPYRREAEKLLELGATPAQVDGAIEDFGFAMGPFAVSDLAGIDVGEAGRNTFRKTASPEQLESFSEIPTKIFEAGRYGQKTGAGYYSYGEDGRTRSEDPAVLEIIEECSREAGVERRTVTNAEVVERCLLALVNEGAKLLDEGIAQRASDIDVVWTAGYGFPAYRGGPMFWATTQGLAEVVERMRELETSIGAYWAPADLLVRLTESGAVDFDNFEHTR